MSAAGPSHPIPSGCEGKACNLCSRDATHEIAKGSTFPWHDGGRIVQHTAVRPWLLCCIHHAVMVHGGCQERGA